MISLHYIQLVILSLLSGLRPQPILLATKKHKNSQKGYRSGVMFVPECEPSAVSHLNVRVLLAANGHLLCQKSSAYDSRPPVSSLHLPIGCCAYPKHEM